jgi:hypothetical protein
MLSYTCIKKGTIAAVLLNRSNVRKAAITPAHAPHPNQSPGSPE